jgi:DNA-binding NarL/FixJ family response regulator
MIRIILADNQAIFRTGTARVLEAQEDFCLLNQCDNPSQLEELLAGTRNSLLLLAESLGADMDRVLAACTANGNQLVLMTETTTQPQPHILRRIDGLLTRHTSADELLACMRRVGSGERSVCSENKASTDTVGQQILDVLTPRELQIVGFIVQGWKNRQISEELRTKEQVVKNYLRSIYDKTGSSDRLELALFTLHHSVLATAAAKAAETARSTVRPPAA